MHYKKCEICGFRSGRSFKSPRIFMARFPLDEIRCKQWVKVTGNEDLVYVPIEKLHTLKYICGNHFENKYFNKNKTRLKKSAIPSKELKANPLLDSIFQDFPCHLSKNYTMSLSDSQNHGSTEEVSTSDAETSSPEQQWSLKPPLKLDDHIYCQPQTTPESRKRKLEHLSDLDIMPRKKKLLRKLYKCKQKIKFLSVGNVKNNTLLHLLDTQMTEMLKWFDQFN